MISLAITTYNRINLTLESFSKVYDHPIISEIVIIDDHSGQSCFEELVKSLCEFEYSKTISWKDGKIRLFRNEQNLGMSRNKAEAISKCRNDWVILLDSDNVLYPEYLDALNKQPLIADVIYCPEKAEPDYDFSSLPCHIDKSNAKDFLKTKEFRILLNTCNYVVSREKYLEVYEYDESIKESDTIHFNHLWLKAGYSFYIVPGMRYYHRRHEGSGWLCGDHEYNLKKADELQKKIASL